MAALVWADLNRQTQRIPRPAPTPLPTRPDLPPAKAEPLPILNALGKGIRHD